MRQSRFSSVLKACRISLPIFSTSGHGANVKRSDTYCAIACIVAKAYDESCCLLIVVEDIKLDQENQRVSSGILTVVSVVELRLFLMVSCRKMLPKSG